MAYNMFHAKTLSDAVGCMYEAQYMNHIDRSMEDHPMWAGECRYCGCLISHDERLCVRCGAPAQMPACPGHLGELANPVVFVESVEKGIQSAKDKRLKKIEGALQDYGGKSKMFDAIDRMSTMTWRI